MKHARDSVKLEVSWHQLVPAKSNIVGTELVLQDEGKDGKEACL